MATTANSPLASKNRPELQRAVAALRTLVAAHESASKQPSASANLSASPEESLPSESKPVAPDPGSGNAAVDHCLQAYAEARRKTIAAGRSEQADKVGRMAFLRAMPPLAGPQNVADFVACVMRGSIEDIIYPFEINRFLYAAQVANCVKNPGVLAAPKRPRGRPSTANTSLADAREEDNSSVNTPPQNC
jgi:hypothetical protein